VWVTSTACSSSASSTGDGAVFTGPGEIMNFFIDDLASQRGVVRRREQDPAVQLGLDPSQVLDIFNGGSGVGRRPPRAPSC